MTGMKTNEFHHEKRNYEDENDSIFSELRMSSIPGSQFSQNDAKLPPPYVLTFIPLEICDFYEL